MYIYIYIRHYYRRITSKFVLHILFSFLIIDVINNYL